MSTKDPAFEKSRSIEDLQHLRLTVLLEELVRDKGIMRAAGELNVDHRTLAAGLESGRLSRRLRGALEKALLEGGGSPAAGAAGAQRPVGRAGGKAGGAGD